MVSFAILGAIEVRDSGRRLPVGGPRQLALLAFLVLHANRAVSRDGLVDALWREQSAAGAVKRLQVAIARLRKALDAGGAGVEAPLRTVSGGYLLAVGSGELDADVFRARVEEGRRALAEGAAERAAAVLREALGLWRGPALAEVAYEDFAQAEIRRLEELRLTALEARVDADLRLGRHTGVIGELEALLGEHPTREGLAGQLMLALYRGGRQADALDAYQRTRGYLAAELGLEPGPALKALQEKVLNQSPSLERSPEVSYPSARRTSAPPPTVARPEAAMRVMGSGEPQDGSTVGVGPALPVTGARRGAGFVGRLGELEILRRAFEAAAAGFCRLVLVEGEPGIGKTRLAAQFAQDCQRGGAVVLYGGCDAETVVPYQPFIEALRRHLAAAALEPLEERIPAHLAALARVLPELASAPATAARPAGDDAAERFQLFDAVAAVLGEVSRARPVLLVLDDLHWADTPTLLMLRQVMRPAGATALLVLACYRAGERREALLDTLVDLRREHVLENISLRGLDQDDAAALIGQLSATGMPPALSRVLWETSRGNPFFLEELVRNRSVAGERATRPIAPASLPDVVKDVIGRRLARRSRELRTVLEIACVAGSQFSVQVLEELSGLAEDALDAALREAVDAHLLVEAPDVYGRFGFEHELTRQTLYEQLGPTRRARLHLRVAEALERLGGADEGRLLAQLAHHFLHAPPERGLAQAAHYAVRAARHALDVLAYEEAARHYEVALSALERLGEDGERRHELLLALGQAHAKAGDPRRARVSFQEAAELARVLGSARGLAQAALGYGFGGQLASGVVDDATVGLLEEALAALGGEDDVLRSRLLARLAIELSFSQQHERRAALSEKAAGLAQPTGDAGALGSALLATGRCGRPRISLNAWRSPPRCCAWRASPTTPEWKWRGTAGA